MNNTETVALTVGLGALGTVLAYYGYIHLNDDGDDKDETIVKSLVEPTKERAVATSDELRRVVAKRKEINPSEDNISNKVSDFIRKLQEEKKPNESKEVNVVKESVVTDIDVKNSGVEEVLMKKPEVTDQQKWKNYWENEYSPNKQKDVVVEYN